MNAITDHLQRQMHNELRLVVVRWYSLRSAVRAMEQQFKRSEVEGVFQGNGAHGQEATPLENPRTDKAGCCYFARSPVDGALNWHGDAPGCQ